MHLILSQVVNDPSKVMEIAKSVSEQSLAAIVVLLVGLCLGGMGLMLKVFLAKIDKKDTVIESVIERYSQDSNRLTSMETSVKENTQAMRENTNVMQRFRDKLPMVLAVWLSIATLIIGCAHTPQEKIVRFAEVSKSVAFEGASLWLVEKPQHKATLQLVVEQLSISIQAKQFTPARLVAILKPLNIRELASKEGRIAIGATVLVWDGLRLTGVIGDTSNLAPVFEGLRDGFQAAIDTTK